MWALGSVMVPSRPYLCSLSWYDWYQQCTHWWWSGPKDAGISI